MEHLQKIETKLIRRADGARLRLDYCLLLDAETGRCGLEVIFRTISAAAANGFRCTAAAAARPRR